MAGGIYQGEGDDPPITDINVTPLVDVMLVLLVIFMVTAKLIAARGVEISRPKAAAGAAVRSPITVAVDKDGALYIEGVKYDTPEPAIAKLRELSGGATDAKVIIDGDQAAAYGGVMRAIDIVTAADITKIALANAPLPANVTPGGGP